MALNGIKNKNDGGNWIGDKQTICNRRRNCTHPKRETRLETQKAKKEARVRGQPHKS